MLRLALSLAFAIILTSLAACNGDEDDQLSNLSESEVAALHQTAEERGQEDGFTPAVPLYIPPGLAHLPDERTVPGLYFGLDLRTLADGPEPWTLSVAQNPGASILDPPFVDLGGVSASAQVQTSASDIMFYALSFNVGGRYFFVDISWRTPDGEIRGAMKSETERVALSLIEDARSQRLITE